MDWFRIVNKATNYIEDNITEDIKLDDIAKECNVSYYYFTKIFTMITGYGLKEYIRNRRITLASYEVSYTNKRIIDIALSYGYSTNESFTRAFKKVHGINPSEARKNKVTVYSHFPILNYEVPHKNLISLKYEILYDISFKFVGRVIHVVEEEYEETQKKLNSFVEKFLEDYPSDNNYYRVHHNLSKDSLEYDYLVGYLDCDFQNDTNELKTLDIKAPKIINFISDSITIENIPELKKIIYNEWYKNDYEIDGIFEVEYKIKKDNSDKYEFHYLVSVK